MWESMRTKWSWLHRVKQKREESTQGRKLLRERILEICRRHPSTLHECKGAVWSEEKNQLKELEQSWDDAELRRVPVLTSKTRKPHNSKEFYLSECRGRIMAFLAQPKKLLTLKGIKLFPSNLITPKTKLKNIYRNRKTSSN